MRTVPLVLAILGMGAASGSVVAPALENEGAPLALGATSHLPMGNSADPGVCTQTRAAFSVSLDSGAGALPASLLPTTAVDECDSDGDCGSGQYCDFDIGECVDDIACDWVCGKVLVCESSCVGHGSDPCVEERTRCWWETQCWWSC